MRGRAVERGRFFDLLAGCRISECHGRSVLTGNCGIARALQGNRSADKVAPQFTSRAERWVSCFFSTAAACACGFHTKLFTRKAKWWLALALSAGEASLLT